MDIRVYIYIYVYKVGVHIFFIIITYTCFLCGLRWLKDTRHAHFLKIKGTQQQLAHMALF